MSVNDWRWHSPATGGGAGAAQGVRAGRPTPGARRLAGQTDRLPCWSSRRPRQPLRRRVARMRGAGPAAALAVRALTAPPPVFPVQVPVDHAGQRKRLPGTAGLRLVAWLGRLKAAGTPTVSAVEADDARRRSPAAGRGTCRPAGPAAASHAANDSPAAAAAATATTTAARRGSASTRRNGSTRTAGAQSSFPGVAEIVCIIVPLALEAAAASAVVVSVRVVIVHSLAYTVASSETQGN